MLHLAPYQGRNKLYAGFFRSLKSKKSNVALPNSDQAVLLKRQQENAFFVFVRSLISLYISISYRFIARCPEP